MSWESKRGYRWPNTSTWRRNSSWSEAIRNSTSRRRQRGKKGRFSRNCLRPQSANRLLLSALKTIERLFRADENAIAIYHRRGDHNTRQTIDPPQSVAAGRIVARQLERAGNQQLSAAGVRPHR